MLTSQLQKIKNTTNTFNKPHLSFEEQLEKLKNRGLCVHTVVKYTVLNNNENLFVSKYQMVLPTEEELIREVEGDVLEIGMMGEERWQK